jgi:hypothetical protein
MNRWHSVVFVVAVMAWTGSGNEDAKRLYDTVLRRSGYNKHIRPVEYETDTVNVSIGLKMAQILDVVSILFVQIHSKHNTCLMVE